MSASMEVMPPNGHETMLEAVFNKIKSILPNDENVKQSPNDSTDAEYRILFSNTADDTERTEKVQKNSDFSFNPLKDTLKIGRAFSSGGVTGTRDTSIGIFGIDITEYVGSTLWSQLSLRRNDITLSSTWDGTNTSLKDAIANHVSSIDHLMPISNGSRLTSANQQGDYNASLFTFMATSSMTTGKPPEDAHIIHSCWDNSGGWDMQLAIGHSNNLYTRSMNGGTWTAWAKYAKSGESQPPTAHNHGTLHSDFTVTLANTTTDSGWSMINSTYNGFWIKSIRYQGSSPAWGVGNYGAGIAFGGGDTKGILSCAYASPSIKIAGGNGAKPVWWIGISGTSGTTYNLNTITNGSARDNTKLPLSGGSVTGDTTFTKKVQVNGVFKCAVISRYNNEDSGYVNHVNQDNNAYRPIRASAFTTMSCKHTKTNVVDISDEDALKLLDVRPVNFDYVEEVGGQKDQIGVLAEDTYKVLPKVVSVPDDYKEENFDISKGIHQPLPSVDYAKFVPYLIKMVQIQQKEIDILKSKLN